MEGPRGRSTWVEQGHSRAEARLSAVQPCQEAVRRCSSMRLVRAAGLRGQVLRPRKAQGMLTVPQPPRKVRSPAAVFAMCQIGAGQSL